MLYQFHWGFRKEGRKLDEYMVWARKELRPTLYRILEQAAKEQILQPQAAYGYWKCAAKGNTVILFEPDGLTEVARFDFPRQKKPGGLCIADFFRDTDANHRDVIGLQVVTIGQHASEVAREWFAADRYKDYLYLHGIGVEMTEALAEYVHKKIRSELGFADEDARDVDDLLSQGYRGSRYSFGYPACPNLADQGKILDLLGAGRIGISMSDEDQLHPEQSTSAIVVHHPQAKYFGV
jgi:5-methyltetrahydrofolate--homocysteine methyltransferase